MDIILHPAQLQRAIVYLEVAAPDANRQGTGFLVTPTQLLTAYHVVEQAESIIVEFRYTETAFFTTARVLPSAELAEYDLALLELAQGPADIQPLPLITATPRVGAQWETSGFPQQHVLTGRPYRGRVLQKNAQAAWPLTLAVEGGSSQDDLTGLSGSPLVVDDQVCGLVRVQQEQDIGAMLLGPVADVLRSLGLTIQDEDPAEHSLPDEEEFPHNQTVLDQLSTSLAEAGTGWHALVGSPGSGKTTLITTLEPAEKQPFIVCGRYYLSRVGSSEPPSLAASRERLWQWLSDTASITLTGERAPAPDPDDSFEKRLQQCHARLAQMARHFQQQQQTAVLLVDGLDETIPDSLRQDFLAVLPLTPPTGLAIVLAATGLEVLSVSIRTQLLPARVVTVTPLSARQCEAYLHHRLPELSVNQAAILAERSEGHPLYLQYLIRQVELHQTEGKEATDWLVDIPPISGEIQRYYERIWPSLAARPAQLQLVLTVAALRAPLSRSELYRMLPPFAQQEFEEVLPKVAYLFKSIAQLALYHASFRQFVREHAAERLQQVQDSICAYFDKHPNQPYTIAHQVYHWAASSTPDRAIQLCSQPWADACARHHVAPDTLLSDVRLVKQLAVKEGKLTEVVRLHLLHVRMSFRYNDMLGSYAAVLAVALLTLGQPEAALNYLVRGDVLQVTENDALTMVQRFYEVGADQEGAYLLGFLRRRGTRLLEEEMHSGSLSGEVLQLYYRSNTLFAYEDSKASISTFVRGIHVLTDLQDDLSEDDSNYQALNAIKQQIMGYHGGFFLWEFDVYALSVRTYEERPELGRVMKPADAGKWAAIAESTLNFQHVNPRRSLPETFAELIQDVALLTNKYGCLDQDLPRVTLLLLQYSDKAELVEELAGRCLKQLTTPTLRDNNGVDLHPNYMRLVGQRALYTGYTSPIGEGYNKLPSAYPGTWERFISSLFMHLGHLRGQLLHLRAKGQEARYGELLPQARQADAALNITLDARSQWERSYALPETLFPMLWVQLADIYATFYPTQIPGWVTTLTRRAAGQLGLYTEGFREACFQVAEVLRRDSTFRKPRFQLLDCLRIHVLSGVQNRWERTGALLQLMEHYADNDNQARSLATYDDVLATSMGPAWYKEDQFALVPAVVCRLPAAQQVVPTLAALLDAAAGEMTFQRYVRDTKADLVEALTQRGRVDLAIRYYKFETLPDAATVRANAYALPTDMVRPGDGYALGARNLVEASALADLLTNLPNLDPRIIWACTLVFSRNEDTWRYAHTYGKLQGQAFSRLLAEYPEDVPASQREWLAGLRAERFTKRELAEYLPAFDKALSDEAHRIIEAALARVPAWQRLVQRKPKAASAKLFDGGEELVGFPGVGRSDHYHAMEEQLKAAAEEAEMGDPQRAGQILGDYATTLWQDGWSIWWGERLGHEMGQLMAKTVEYTATAPNLLHALRHPIANDTEWTMAKKLLEWTAPQLNEAEQRQLAEAVTDHLRLLTQPSQTALNKYEWLAEPDGYLSTEQHIIRLLIWHLVHPNSEWQKVTAHVLRRLSTQMPQLVISCLLDVALMPRYTGAWHEAAATLLPDIAHAQPVAFWAVIALEQSFGERVIQLRHLLIQHDIQQALQSVAAVVPEARALLQQIQASVPPSRLLTGRTAEVALDEDYLAFIGYELEQLNDGRWLNGQFCQDLLSTLAILCQPLSVEDAWEADRYVQRSFAPTKPFLLPFQAQLNYALNQAIMSRADQQGWSKLVTILRPN